MIAAGLRIILRAFADQRLMLEPARSIALAPAEMFPE
jgi:hypothetical protein